MKSFQGVLANIPGLGGYLAGEQNDQDLQRGQLQQLGILSQLQGQAQMQQQRQAALLEQQQLKGVLSQSGGNPEKAVQALLGAGTPQSIDLAAKLKAFLPKPMEPFTLSPGAQRFGPDGKLIAEVPNRPLREQNPSNLSRLIAEMEAIPEGDPRRKHYENAIRKESETSRQITNVNQPAPVTAVTIQDPNDPNGTIIIDGRTKTVLGKGPKLTEAGRLENKRQFNMQGIGATLKKAEELLTGSTGRNLPTGSTMGNVLDVAGGVVGYSPPGAAEAEDLRVIGGALVSKMPRMEGPQSDKDVALYREMAGRVADATIPRERRLSALNQVKDLWAKYERLNPDAFGGGASPAAGGIPPMSDIDAEIARRRGRR